ncbi:sugar transferase [uncultured Amphritea sp.]|uniref:sugar transferase n=1 Tax=uncultured Amphritea sp. TaxID=981605 RepID=UPI0026366302|nr:sugar transferase [uncultured Amphritea sp.]
MKRIFDISVAVFVLIIIAPILLIIAVLVKIESKGPVLFNQERVGLYGESFYIYKFRSMVQNASEIGPYFTDHNDKRITKVGKLIRRTSIDELPQIINVIKGEMSLVGPRPNVFAQRPEYDADDWEMRNSVRPGITGLAQALLRSSATPDERTALDLEYVEKASFMLDLKILLLTVKQVFMKGGN